MESATQSVCPVCFDSKPLKFVSGRCKHKFCTECLSIVLGSLASGIEYFECPSCKADCPVPWNGVDGLVDVVEEGGSDAVAPFVAQQEPTRDQASAIGRPIKEDGKIDICNVARKLNCGICLHRKNKVQAIGLCAQCGDLNLCRECTKDHEKNKITQGHVLVFLDAHSQQQEGICGMHSSLLNTYCLTCNTAVCVICVMLEHGDHNVEKLEDILQARSQEVRVTLKEREQELEELHDLRDELTLLHSVTLDEKDTLINKIEDHAQTSIDQITAWKDDFKEQVKTFYDGLEESAACVKKISETDHKLTKTVTRLQSIGLKQIHPCHLDEQVALLHDLKAPLEMDEVAVRESRKRLRELHRNTPHFSPVRSDSPSEFGELIKTNRNRRKFKTDEIFKHTMIEDCTNQFIPCVADLDDYFAVAHPIKRGQVSSVIYIYDNECDLARTITEHPVHDMSRTKNNELAVLSDGTGGTIYRVKIFDPETGCLTFTCDLGIAKAISLGVSLKDQFVILGDDEHRQKHMTVVDRDGCVKCKYVFGASDDSLKKPNRIACGGKFIFVKGRVSVSIYEIKSSVLMRVKTCSGYKINHLTDITATPLGDFFLADSDSPDLYLYRFQQTENKAEYYNWWHGVEVGVDLTDNEGEARISTATGHEIVISNGTDLRVLNIK